MGPNLARNFSLQPGCRLASICDLDPKKLEQAARHYPQSKVTLDYNDLLSSPEIDVILIATPVWSHFELARKALEAGKDIFVEKPFTTNSSEAEQLVALAESKGRIIAVDHTFLYTGAVQKLKTLVEDGDIGDLVYIDSVRINLGLFQQDVNVLFDLAPHDLSIISYLTRRDPVSVQAMGMRIGSAEQESTVYLHLEYDDGIIAHCHLSWLSPMKMRQMLICGTNKMVVYDDVEPSEKVRVYDKGIVMQQQIDEGTRNKLIVDYRLGDMLAPKLEHREALAVEAQQFLNCVRDRTPPLSDGKFGLKIMKQIEACQASIEQSGLKVKV